MKIIQGRASGPSDKRSATFTGDVWADPVLAPTDGVTINHVMFTPGARTHWHSHSRGQVLVVTSGEGRAGDDAGEVRAIRAGDVVLFEPGERHWHGAAPESFMAHLAISIGEHDWQEPVEDADYTKAPS
ncbi:MAG TPA: cupin domain-containing protein [Solirubrobacteraceae bacterium]|jgi:quercetin dioxygenase-like cupin family protein|nr:cupin domain-containing protein [Solirubrobacteraceae bacterium]